MIKIPLIKLAEKLKSNDWYWHLSDYPKDKNGLKVFSCFACAGGSTMGYKLAGCDVVGCLEIDKRMNDVYVKNHNPKHNFLMDIRDFNKIQNDELPAELLDLDILDGSPPCTTFSMIGKREETWGKKKKFAEGQKEQILDELIFEFSDTVNKLKPKVVIMENVRGLILGNAIDYYNRYLKLMAKYGYKSVGYLLKGEEMGVPQKRHRVFVISVRNDIDFNFNNLNLNFNYSQIPFGEVKETGCNLADITGTLNYQRIKQAIPNKHHRISDIIIDGKEIGSAFGCNIMWDESVAGTIICGGSDYRGLENTYLTSGDYRNLQTFPQDFEFLGKPAKFICGMSVPPIMTKRIVTRLIESGIFENEI